MPRPWRILILALPLLAALPLAAVPQQPGARPRSEAVARAELRGDKDYSWLLQEARAFLKLPERRREQMRQLDADLHQVGSLARQEHLKHVLRRYADWLAALPEGQRRLVRQAATKPERLRVIRSLREAQWLARQPRAVRDGLGALQTVAAAQALAAPSEAAPGPALAGLLLAHAPGRPSLLVGQLHRQERRRRQEWHIALRHWEDLGKRPVPTRLVEFPAARALEHYVQYYLQPALSQEEKELLANTEGNPVFPFVLVQLADRHPPALKGKHGITRFQDLAPEVQKQLRRFVTAKGMKAGGGLKKVYKSAEGKWPRFAEVIARLAEDKGIKLSPQYELWPSRYKDLSHDVQKFLNEKLLPRLSAEEKQELTAREGRWPDYPNKIEQLATMHGLHVPWQTLPGPRKAWDPFRPKSRT